MGFPAPPGAYPYIPTALEDWDADFFRQTGKRVTVELEGPCWQTIGSCIYALGTAGCLRCGQPQRRSDIRKHLADGSVPETTALTRFGC